MDSVEVDCVIFGSGFGGSIMAMILRRLGYSVALIERGKHPRFAIGESSTPFSNLLLEEIARRFELPFLRELSEWGSWQQTHPEIACGIKRGFTFFHHRAGERLNFSDRSRQLLVAASPNDSVADTHWYRPELDHFLVEQARGLGVIYLDEVSAIGFENRDPWVICATRAGTVIRVTASFAIDASGRNGVLARELNIPEAGFASMPGTTAIYAHFRGVQRLDGLAPELANPRLPYPPDDAALHHVFSGGWSWVLHFNNGITSAGVMLERDGAMGEELRQGQDPAEIWNAVLASFPSIGDQFEKAVAVTPFYRSRVAFRRSTAAGANWALLPSAAGFVDPMLSTGFALNLFGILRLAEIFTAEVKDREEALVAYNVKTLRELDATADLVSALYARMGSFEEFSQLTLLYFAALSFTETAWRLGKKSLASGFLLTNEGRFNAVRERFCGGARRSGAHLESIFEAIEPWDIAGLSDVSRVNWYPVQFQDLIDNRSKLSASLEEIRELMRRIGVQEDYASDFEHGH